MGGAKVAMAAASAKTGERSQGGERTGVTRVSNLEAIRAFVENAPIAVAMTDRELRYIAVSPTWMADMAIPREQLIGRSSYDSAPETRQYEALHRQVLEGQSITGKPERLVLPNGEERWMNWSASPWRDERGSIGGILIASHNVTAQMEAEDQARRSRAFAAMVLQHSPLALLVRNDAGEVVLMNQAMEKLFGVSAADHVGRPISELLPRQTSGHVAEEDRRVLESWEPLVVEEQAHIASRGGMGTLRRTKAAMRDAGGRTYLLTICEDITESRKTQSELETTRAFMETVIDNLPAGLTVKDASTGRLMISNQASARLYGIGYRGENIGRTHEEVFAPELAARFSAQDREVIESGASRLFEEEPVPTPDGVRYLNMRKVLIPNADGSDYLMTISEDVTERRFAVDEWQRTRAFLETVIDSVPAGITVKEASTGRILITNPAVEAIFGIDRGDNVGKTGMDLFPAEQAAHFAEQDQDVVASGEMRTYEEQPVWTRYGVRYLNRRKVLIRNPEGTDYLLSISEDVTERKLAQDALRDALARAEQANVAKSEFLANMSHEIRTPLNGVLGLADALSRMELTPKQREIVGMIVGSGRALTAILSDVLDLAKAEAGQLQLSEEGFSLAETIGEAAFLFEAVAGGKGVGFSVEFEPGGPERLIGDPLRIKQIVSNLISNAVKFTSEGVVAVRVGAAGRQDGSALLTVSVSDTGPGFSEETRARLFSRFEQGDGSITRRYGGTGLGLSIANALAQMMGGEIDCSAVPGKGATFIFTASLGVDAGPGTRAACDSGPPVLDRRLRVLLAEDHEVNQKVVQLMLADAAELLIVGDGLAAVNAALGRERFDVVLMDTQMPVMDGLTAIQLIREGEASQGLSRTPIISLTANAMSHQVAAALAAGADLHLAKPITADALYAAIERALETPADGAARTSAA
jgi:two-component system, sensor histidine kinase